MRELSLFDLTAILPKRLPALAFSHTPGGFYSRAIRRHTGGEYTHAMWLHEPGRFASQGWTFREVHVREYGKSIVEIWTFPHWTDIERDRVRTVIQSQIDRHGFYDFLGIVGQFFRVPLLNNPFRDYCSEACWQTFRRAFPGKHYPRWHPSPKDLRARVPDLGGEVYGVYDPFSGDE